MNEYAVTDNQTEKRSEPRKQVDQYYSLELSIDGLSAPYQFKIWNMAPTSMCVLVKEDSEVLQLLKVGDTLNVKYYSVESAYTHEYLETTIRHITKDDEGRFKGHYLVGLEIIDSKNKAKAH